MEEALQYTSPELIYIITDLIRDSFEHFKNGYAELYVNIDRTLQIDLRFEKTLILDDALNGRPSRVPLNDSTDRNGLVRWAWKNMVNHETDLREQIEWSKTQVDIENPVTSRILDKVAEFRAQHKEAADEIITNNRWRYTDQSLFYVNGVARNR